jgi:DNA polymerase
MYAPRLPRLGTFEVWRDAARRLAHVPPADVDWGWHDAGASMFDAALPPPAEGLTVPKAFVPLSRLLVQERSGRGFTLAHALLHRMQSETGLIARRADRDVAAAEAIAKEIRRDIHKMHAFVRFREAGPSGPRRRFAAWFEPDNRIEEGVADFFVNRFGDMDWAIVTPEVTLRYEAGGLSMEAVETLRPDDGDPLEALWTTYYSNIFNPARLKVDAMRAEMPRKYWRNLPEARAIPSLIAGARERVVAMKDAAPRPPRPIREETEMARDLFDKYDTLGAAHAAAKACTLCPLYSDATQVVFGEGPPDAPVMIVGEQPGDTEDLAGRPFVGPAGQLFDEVAEMAGLDRERCYVTNAVKHFKFVQKGRRRIHQKPGASEIRACTTWLESELSLVDPKVVVAMGATALHGLTGKGQGILKRRGTVEETKDGRPLLITVHPSYLLRLPDPNLRAEQTELFREDLSRIGELLKS